MAGRAHSYLVLIFMTCNIIVMRMPILALIHECWERGGGGCQTLHLSGAGGLLGQCSSHTGCLTSCAYLHLALEFSVTSTRVRVGPEWG